jgi:hypothetical protein
MFTMNSEVVGRPSLVVSDDLVRSERRRFTVSRTFLHDIITVRLGYHIKFCASWVLKMLTGGHRKQRTVLASTFFRMIPQSRQFIS